MLHSLWRRAWLVLLFACAGIIAGVSIYSRTPRVFSSQSRIYIDAGAPKILGDSTGAVLGVSDNYLYSQCELIRSDVVLQQALAQHGLARLNALQHSLNPIDDLKQSLKAEVETKNQIITVSAESAHPDDAAAIVNAVVTAYVNYKHTQDTSAAADSLQILRTEKDRREVELSQQIATLTQARKATGDIVLGGENKGGGLIERRLTQLSDELLASHLKTINALSQLAVVKQSQNDPAQVRQLASSLSGGGASSEVTRYVELQQQLHEADMELALLRGSLTSNHVSVVAQEHRIEQLSAQLEQQDKNVGSILLFKSQMDLQMAQEREKQLQADVDQQNRLALALNDKRTDIERMAQAVQRTEHLCDVLDDRIKQLQINQGADRLATSVLEPARAGGTQLRPSKAAIIGGGTLIGLMLGISAAMGLAWMDQRLRSVEEVKGALNVRILGSVSRIAREYNQERGMIMHLGSMSDEAETYRTVRTAIYNELSESDAKSILVTSPEPEDGKSTVASNLAIVLAHAGERVLLIDADFRRPTQHRIFSTPCEGGLSEVLTGRGNLGGAIRKTPVGGLDLLVAGDRPGHPSELLNGRPFVALLKKLCESYDRLIIDSPPVMEVADTRILATRCDVTILVLRAQKTQRQVARHAVEALESVGARLLGVIVNDLPRTRKNGYLGVYVKKTQRGSSSPDPYRDYAHAG